MTELWPAVVDHVRSSGSEMLSSLFDGSRPLAVDTERSVLKVGFPASAKFNKRKAEAQANVERIAESVKAIVGERLRPVYELIEVDEDDAAAAANGATAMAEEEIIELIKAKFDAQEVVDDDRDPRERDGLMPKGPDMGQLMKQVQQMQAEMAKAQEELKNETVEASAGGGMVKVTMSGDMVLREITISPEAIDPEDPELLQDMVTAAVNEGLRAAQELAQTKLGGITGGMGGGLPGLGPGGMPGM